LLGALALLPVVGCGGEPAADPSAAPVVAAGDAYREDIETWRRDREERLRSETGWTTIVGLHWLEPGDNAFGTDPSGKIVFPEGTAPAKVGTFTYGDGTVRVRAEPGAGLMLVAAPAGDEPAEDTPVEEMDLRPDTSGERDTLRVGDLTLWVIERSGRHGIRVRDPNSRQRTEFAGLDWYPIDTDYRVEARFVPFDEPKTVKIDTVIDSATEMEAPGHVEFELAGETVRMEPMTSGERYWFIFRDGTSGKETYGAGRYLYADAAVDGKLTIDFNRAYNPPCAFTTAATCPLPPRQNWLTARIEAGEKDYRGLH
jgi:uncharacterized protein (DUF1684 family)